MSGAGPMAELTRDRGRSVRSVVGRAALIILVATLASRLVGMARDVVVAYFFGADQATDAFFLAYRIPSLLTMIVAGALTAALIPLVSHRLATGRQGEARQLFVRLANSASLAMIIVSGLLIALAQWIMPIVGFGFTPEVAGEAVFLFRVLMIGFVFAGLTGLVQGMLNSLHKFALAAFSPAAGTVVTLAITSVFAQRLGLSALAIGTVCGWIAGLAVVLIGVRGQGISYRLDLGLRDPLVRDAGRMVWPVLLGSAVGSIGLFANQMMGSTLEAASISSLNYADKLFQLCLGLFVSGISVPIFPLLSEQVAAGDPRKVKDTIGFTLRLMGFLMVPITVVMIILRYPIVGLFLQHGKFAADDTSRTAWTLLFLALGLYGYAGRDTLVRVFYAYHDMRTPVKISVITVVLSIGFSYVLMQSMGVGGLALGYVIALNINFVFLLFLLRKKLGQLGYSATLSSFARVMAASAVMGIAVWGTDYALAGSVGAATVGNAVRVAAGLAVGVGVFVSAARLLGSPELVEMRDMVRSMLGRS